MLLGLPESRAPVREVFWLRSRISRWHTLDSPACTDQENVMRGKSRRRRRALAEPSPAATSGGWKRVPFRDRTPSADARSVSCPSGNPNQRPNRRRLSPPHAIKAILRSRVPHRPLSSRPPRPVNQQLKQNPNSGGDCGLIESSVNPQRLDTPRPQGLRRLFLLSHRRPLQFQSANFSSRRPWPTSPRPSIRSNSSREASERHSSRDRLLSVTNIIDPQGQNRICSVG